LGFKDDFARFVATIYQGTPVQAVYGASREKLLCPSDMALRMWSK